VSFQPHVSDDAEMKLLNTHASVRRSSDKSKRQLRLQSCLNKRQNLRRHRVWSSPKGPSHPVVSSKFKLELPGSRSWLNQSRSYRSRAFCEARIDLYKMISLTPPKTANVEPAFRKKFARFQASPNLQRIQRHCRGEKRLQLDRFQDITFNGNFYKIEMLDIRGLRGRCC